MYRWFTTSSLRMYVFPGHSKKQGRVDRFDSLAALKMLACDIMHTCCNLERQKSFFSSIFSPCNRIITKCHWGMQHIALLHWLWFALRSLTFCAVHRWRGWRALCKRLNARLWSGKLQQSNVHKRLGDILRLLHQTILWGTDIGNLWMVGLEISASKTINLLMSLP